MATESNAVAIREGRFALKYAGPSGMSCRDGDTCTGCVSNTGYLAHGDSKGEARGRRRHKNNSRVVRNLRQERGHEEEKSQTKPN